VFVGLLGLLTFRFMMLRSLGIAGAVVVALAVLAALTLLPALLGILGPLRVTGGRWPRFAIDTLHRDLSLLVIARLPFAVPTDPVYAARAALYDDSFSQFALPQAVIRFKQGFGRLIRSRAHRGGLIVLDPRIVAKQYGASFLQALPPCPIKQVPVRQMADEIEVWLSRPRADSPPLAASPAAIGDAGA